MVRSALFVTVLGSVLWLSWAGFEGTSGIDAVSGATGRGRWEPPPPAPVCVVGWHKEAHPSAGFTACVPDNTKGHVNDLDWSFELSDGKLVRFTLVPKAAELDAVVADLVSYLTAKHVPAAPVEGVKYKWADKVRGGGSWWQAWPVIHLRYGLLVAARCKGTEADCGAFFKGAAVSSTTLEWPGDVGVYDFSSWARMAKDTLSIVATPGSPAQGAMPYLLEQYGKLMNDVLGVTGNEQPPALFVNVYQDAAQMYRYTRSEQPFLMLDVGEVHVTFAGQEKGITGRKEFAEYLLASVWGPAGNVFFGNGLAAALDGVPGDKAAAGSKVVNEGTVKFITLHLPETWLKADAAHLAVAGGFCRWLLDTYGAEKVKGMWSSQDPRGESPKLFGKGLEELEKEFAAAAK